MVEEIQKKDNNKERYAKVILGVFFFISWVVLFSIKITSDISLAIPLGISIFFTIIFIISLIGKKFSLLASKLEEKEKERHPITNEQLEEILKREVSKMWNYIEQGVPIKKKTENINNSVIYECHLKLYREMEFGDKFSDEIIIIVNATYPELEPSVLPEECNHEEIEAAKNLLSRSPLTPRVEETETIVSQFGDQTKRTKVTDFSKQQNENNEEVV